MNLFGIEEKETTMLWTRQVPQVVEELERCGIYRAKKDYIQQKNGNISEFYFRVYDWYRGQAAQYMEIPEGAYPIWFNLSEDMMLQQTEDTVILRLEVPSDKLLLCNYDAWGYVVNYFYVPLNEEDEKEHLEELKRYGMRTGDELLLTAKGNFYPLLKKKLLDSWKRTFTLLPGGQEGSMVATTWEIQRDWIREISPYKGSQGFLREIVTS